MRLQRREAGVCDPEYVGHRWAKDLGEGTEQRLNLS